jgi:hypothetical protein
MHIHLRERKSHRRPDKDKINIKDIKKMGRFVPRPPTTRLLITEADQPAVCIATASDGGARRSASATVHARPALSDGRRAAAPRPSSAAARCDQQGLPSLRVRVLSLSLARGRRTPPWASSWPALQSVHAGRGGFSIYAAILAASAAIQPPRFSDRDWRTGEHRLRFPSRGNSCSRRSARPVPLDGGPGPLSRRARRRPAARSGARGPRRGASGAARPPGGAAPAARPPR